jgi:hypothetical protein
MSIVGNVRAAIQDLVTPDLKVAIAQNEALDKKFDVRFDAVDKRIDATAALLEAKLKASDEILTARHNELKANLEAHNIQHTARYDATMKALEVDARLRALEDDKKKRDKGDPPESGQNAA